MTIKSHLPHSSVEIVEFQSKYDSSHSYIMCPNYQNERKTNLKWERKGEQCHMHWEDVKHVCEETRSI